MSRASIPPLDDANLRTVLQGHGANRVPPTPKEVYDFAILGGGPAGLSAANVAHKCGASVAVIERNLLGGTCVNFGCNPSKTLIRAGRAAREARRAERFGVRGSAEVDWAAVMQRVREIRAWSSSYDSIEKVEADGIQVFIGEGRFVAADALDVDGLRIRFRKALIATGSRPAIPDLPGLADVLYQTTDTLFDLTASPGRVAVIGAGPLGCEIAQALRRLGCEVAIVSRGDKLLSHEAPEASDVLANVFAAEGIELHLGAEPLRVEPGRLHFRQSGAERSVAFDTLLVGTGRTLNVAGLGLELAGVAYDPNTGIKADGLLRTTNPAIYAAGDVCRPEKYSHAASVFAKLAARNAVGGVRNSANDLVIPHVTFTDPEVAVVGLTLQEAQRRGVSVDVHTLSLAEVGRAVIDGENGGFIQLVVRGPEIVGATLVAAHAGESQPLLTLLVQKRMTLADLAAVIPSYPTQAEVIQRLAAKLVK